MSAHRDGDDRIDLIRKRMVKLGLFLAWADDHNGRAMPSCDIRVCARGVLQAMPYTVPQATAVLTGGSPLLNKWQPKFAATSFKRYDGRVPL